MDKIDKMLERECLIYWTLALGGVMTLIECLH